MDSGFALAPLPRGTLLSPSERAARLDAALPLMLSTVEGETDAVTLQATLACLLWETMVQANWCGFYRRVGESMLAVGPYQGTLGCLRIDFARGVCGAAAREQRTQLVEDVHTYAGHIACDVRSRSEVVVPVLYKDRLIAVLDIDSPHVAGFCEDEAKLLEGLIAQVFARNDIQV